MRQAIGGTWIVQLVIVFMLLFVGYIIITLSYSKVIRIKNETISMIEKYEGLNEDSITLVNNYLKVSGYATTGVCITSQDEDGSASGTYGALSLDDAELSPVQRGQKYFYCVKKYKGANTTKYYQIRLFYRFNLPVFGNISSFDVRGTTMNFQSHDDDIYDNVIGG